MILGPLRPNATYGEKLVYRALARLNDEYLVWPELPVQGEAERKHPDFVILHPLKGLIVLEVKDWRRIRRVNPYGVLLDGEERPKPNPVTRAKEYCETIVSMIRETYSKALAEGSFVGPPPRISYAYAVVLTWVEGPELLRMEKLLRAKGYLLNREDFSCTARLESCLDRLPRPGGIHRLTEDEVQLVRRALFPEGEIRDESGRYIGFMSTEQEVEVKDGIFPAAQEETSTEETESVQQGSFLKDLPVTVVPDVDSLELPEHGQQVAERFNIRLVRGVAGSGKTQILCKRAVLLSKTFPDWHILVLTRNRGLALDLERVLEGYERIQVFNFDRLCRSQLEAVGLWRAPVDDTDQPGWIAQVIKEVPGADAFDPRFLRDEFNWMKHVDVRDRESYLAENRDGREVPLSRKKQRPVVFEVFQRYEERLQRFRQMVWADVPLLMLEAMDEGLLPCEQYDAILVDEAQMFPPTWLTVVKRWLKKPHGMLFLVADTTQNIFGRFSWQRKGIDVRGRSRVLRRPYRSTYPIARAAYELVRTEQDLQALLKQEGDELIKPDLQHPSVRQGETPRLVRCSSLEAELDYVTREIKCLIEKGCWPSEIAVLTLRKVEGQQRFAAHLLTKGIPVVLSSEYRYSPDGPRVVVGLMSGVTGQEFKAVFVCELQDLFRRDSTAFSGSWLEFKAQQKRLLYTAMTRARDYLHICYRQSYHSTLCSLEQVMGHVAV